MSEVTEAERRAQAERNLCGLVSGVAKRIEGQVRERAATLGLTAPQAVALRELTGPMTMRELAERMSCEPSNATFVVDKLEKRGLVERHADTSDRRVRRLVLTAEGTRIRDDLLRVLTTNSPLSALSPKEQGLLHDLLLRASANGQ